MVINTANLPSGADFTLDITVASSGANAIYSTTEANTASTGTLPMPSTFTAQFGEYGVSKRRRRDHDHPVAHGSKARKLQRLHGAGPADRVNAYNGSGNDAQNYADGFTWETGITTYAAQGYPLRRSNNEPGGTAGPWGPSLDASHGVSYCYFMALISGDEWLMEAQVDLATNLVHQAIYGYLNNVLPFPADSDSNSGRAAWNPSCPTDRWTGLMAQWQADAIRAMGWTQLIQDHAIALVPVDHVAHDYLQAAMVHQGDFIQTNLDYLPADFTAAAFYSPNSQLGLQCLFSPWMIAFVAVGAYAHYLANEDPRWKRLGDFAAAGSIKQAALGR